MNINSPEGFSPGLWGPALWHVLHTISFNYPVNPTRKDKRHYYNFICSLQHVLPCGVCRRNFPEKLRKLKFSRRHLEDRAAFSKFIYDLHTEVNRGCDYSFPGLQYAYNKMRVSKPKCAIVVTKNPPMSLVLDGYN